MGIYSAVILLTLLSLGSADDNLLRRKRKGVISVSQGGGVDPEKLTSTFWENDKPRDILNHPSKDQIALNRILQDRATMSMITSAPVSPGLTTSAPVSTTTSAPVSAIRTPAPTSTPMTTLAPVILTSAPTFAPTRDCELLSRDQVLLDLLSTVSDMRSQIEDESTPQGAAYKWMLSSDTTTDPCGNPSGSLSLYGLLVFYHSTEGVSWANNTGWLLDSDYCGEWYGVTCNSVGEVTEVTLGKQFLFENKGLLNLFVTNNAFDRFKQYPRYASERVGGDTILGSP